jgi:hypothetical protein
MFRGITSILTIFAVLTFFSSTSLAKVLFEEDWESGKIDASKWKARAQWKIVDSGNVKGLGKHVLELDGGEAGITVKNDFKDFVYEADFQALGNKITGFVFRAQDDASNFYMHQISADGSGHTPNNMRWHWKVGGTWNVEPIPFDKVIKILPSKWYHARFVVQGFNFKVFVVEKEKHGKADMLQIGDWTDNKKGGSGNFATGALGFRSSGGEKMQYDNIVVGDTLADIPVAVEPKGKLATAWGMLKTSRY